MKNHLFSGLSAKQLLEANFGLEREGLRVTKEGLLSLKPHPEVFGDKKTNPYITTDFSESQLELVTPVFRTTGEAVDFLDSLYNIAALELNDEYIWPQSMPANTPDHQNIPIASFPNEKKDEKYREYLKSKYGAKKQLISGIHINFSLGEQLISTLYEQSGRKQPFRSFKQNLYLKLTRNYLRYHWLLVYILGAANITHKSYDNECLADLEEMPRETYAHTDAISYRNSACGYQNKESIQLDYSTLEGYIDSIYANIHKGKIMDIRELYVPVRLKGPNPVYSPEDLLRNGIEYVEIRTIDINPFVKSGMAAGDLQFIHLFLLYCLQKEESSYGNWQIESRQNSEKVASHGLNRELALLRDGEAIPMERWALEIIGELADMNRQHDFSFGGILKEKEAAIKEHRNTYAYKLYKLCREKGFIQAHLQLAQTHKEAAAKERFLLKPYTDMELSTQILMKECIKRGISIEILDRKENFIELSKGGYTQYIKQATKTSKDQYITVLAMENKSVTKHILKRNGIHVPEGEEYSSIEAARQSLSKWAGQPAVIKPKSTNFGLGISIFPDGTDQAGLAEIAFKEDNSILIESFVEGKEYRFLVIGEETIAVLHRVPANVIGDGNSTIQQLIEKKNRDPLRGTGHITPLEKIQINDSLKLYLQQQGLTIDSVIPEGKIQYIRENSNISTGGDSIDVTDTVPDIFKHLAVKAAKSVGANICGVDMMIENVEDGTSPYSIIELNFNPAIHIHAYPYKGKERNIAYPILKLLGF